MPWHQGLLDFSQFPTWGLVPIHLITKFSSSLFILVFGISLGVIFAPAVGTDRWPQMRRKLLLRGLLVLFWYKVLTIGELKPQYPREVVLQTLVYERIPSYVELHSRTAIVFMANCFRRQRCLSLTSF